MTNSNLECADIRALLSAIVDDQLAQEERHQVECHLAGCAACRSAIDRTERIEEMIRTDAALLAGDEGLSPTFMEAVLARTVHAAPEAQQNNRIMAWSGWLVAAAVVAAALIIRSPAGEDPRAAGTNERVAQHSTRTTSLTSISSHTPWQRSWTFDGEHAGAGAMTVPAVDASASSSFQSAASATASLADAWQRSTLRSDLEALHAAALVLDTFIEIDDEGFRAVESVREVVLYDELIPRLSRIRTALDADDRGLVTAAETLLFRIVHDPLDAADLTDMRDLVRRADLAESLRRIGDRGLARRSL